MIAMQNAEFVLGSYAVTFGGVALYVWRMLARARRTARELPEEDRPWT